MDRWGPDVQEKRDKRDRVWDEMVRVVSHKINTKENKMEYYEVQVLFEEEVSTKSGIKLRKVRRNYL